MDNIEKIKELFVPVTERLPEDTGFYLCLTIGGGITSSYYLSTRKIFNIGNSIVTHYLDLYLLTTKAKAIELAEKVFFEVNDYDKRKAIEKGIPLL